MKKTLYSLSAIAFFISLFIQIIFLFALNKNYYHRMHDKLEIVETMDRNEADIKKAMDSLIDYIEDESVHLDDDFFNEREILHMVDVRELYQSTKQFQRFSFSIALVNFFWIIFKEKKENIRKIFAKSILEALKTLAFFLAFLILFFLLDFDFFWNSFHQIFFSNDLWLLNPLTDRMIQMLPGEIFQGLILRIALTSSFLFSSIYLIAYRTLQESND